MNLLHSLKEAIEGRKLSWRIFFPASVKFLSRYGKEQHNWESNEVYYLG